LLLQYKRGVSPGLMQ